jgi:flagellar hook capping protein FlgD
MRVHAGIVIAIAAAAVLAPASARAGGDPPPPPAPYALFKESAFEWGCYGPCACPVMQRSPVQGTFRLTKTGEGSGFEEYAVTDVHWTVPEERGTVTGSGTYLRGTASEQHRLVLDLALDSSPPQHFDSGLVPGGESFPRIDVAVAMHGFYCWDTTYAVHAGPTTAGIEDQPASTRLRAVTPNPFVGSVRLELALRVSGPVDLRLFDVLGREVRVLARGAWLEAGAHALAWDGRAADGRPAPAGVYFARLEAGGREELRAVVKLR